MRVASTETTRFFVLQNSLLKIFPTVAKLQLTIPPVTTQLTTVPPMII